VASPFDGLAAALLGSVMATPVTYLPGGGSPIVTRALVPQRDPEADFGEIRRQRDVIQIELARSALTDPAKGDRFIMGGRTYQVSEAPASALSDPDNLFWLVSGHLVDG
jgi:hypothetical protein